ncbi:hypothetical protein O3P69_005587 [Scylla paramamosain]|uniref:Uncharacterized protein n=1 Tax=Scylla paramamosain TaxID=85552 RepID=A0AAW0U8J2_SCYPA
MKGFGRALEINFLFLLVVALLVVLQLILQGSQRELLLQLKERGGEGEAAGEYPQHGPPPSSPLTFPDQDIHAAGDAKMVISDNGGGGGILAAPVVPNIRRSFPKRKAPYVRKAKNKKKKKNRKGKKQLARGVGGAEGTFVKGSGNIGVIEKSEKL